MPLVWFDARSGVSFLRGPGLFHFANISLAKYRKLSDGHQDEDQDQGNSSNGLHEIAKTKYRFVL